MREILFVFLFFLSVSLYGQEQNDTSEWTRTELFFGGSIPSGGKVTKRKWKNFVYKYVIPKFPEGFTVLQATGKWLDEDTNQTISEKSRVIIFVYPDTGKVQADSALHDISQAYMDLFDQQSVLRMDSKSKVVFY